MSVRKVLAHIKEAMVGAEQAEHLLEGALLLGNDPSADQTLRQIRKSINKLNGHAAIAHDAVNAVIEQRKKISE